MEMALISYLMGQVSTDSDQLYVTLIELSTEFFKSTQFADTIRSPMSSKKFDKNKMPIETF